MNDGDCVIMPEGRIVDYVLGKLGPVSTRQLEEHLAWCHPCRERAREWAACLLESQADPSPSAPLPMRRRIMRRAGLKLLRQRVRAGFRQGRLVGLCSAVLLLVVTIGLVRVWQAPPQELNAPHPNVKLAHPAQLLSVPGTTKYSASTGEKGRLVRGDLWHDPRSGDVLLILDGVETKIGIDYQVWSLKDNLSSSMGLLELQESLGVWYAAGLQVQELDQIMVSAEPEGGSSRPTGPETIRIGLRP